MTRTLAILLAILFGALLGAVVAVVTLLRLRTEASGDEPPARPPAPAAAPEVPPAPRPPAPPPVSAPERPILPPELSFYLSNLRSAGLAIAEMTPLLLTPLEREQGLEECPELLVIRSGQGSYDPEIRPFLAALSRMRFEAPSDGEPLAREAAAAILRQLDRMVSVASGPVGTPPLRAMVKHYPRPEFDGRCVTVQVVFYTVPDPHFDRPFFMELARAGGLGKEVRGTLLLLRKTYRIDGGSARLIEAEAEAHTEVRIARRRETYAGLQADDELRRVGMDSASSAHFAEVGAGLRLGLLWIDRSNGVGPARPHACAFRIAPEPSEGGVMVEDAPIPEGLAKALLAFVAAA